MPRISGPELRPDWIGTGSSDRDWLAGSSAGWWTVWRCRKAGHRWRELCVCHAATCGPWGEVRLRRQPRAVGACSGQRGPSGVRLVAVGNAGGNGLGGIGSVCPERRAGLLASGARCVCGVHRKPEVFVRGSRDWGEVGLVQSGSVLSCPSSPPGWWRLVMSRGSGVGWLAGMAWRLIKPSFRAKRGADPESMPY